MPSNVFKLSLVWAMCWLVAIAATEAGAQEEKETKEKKPQLLNSKGLRFQYPAGWEISSDKMYTGTRLLIVSGPDNAIVTIQLTESDVADTIEEYSTAYSQGAAKSSDLVKVTKQVMGKVKKHELGFQLIVEEFTIALKTGDNTPIPHRREFLSKKLGPYTCFIVCQAATNHLKKVEPGFAEILKSIRFREDN